MTAERWQRIRFLFDGALSLSPEQQLPFLERESPDDAEVRAEVLKLLEHERHNRDFSQFGAAPRATSFAPGELAGGRFRIARLLGRGGMGEVYEAEDTLLGERVALKAIRPEIASVPATLTRFRHEIQLARRITHSNVCRIFDLEMHQGSVGTIAFLTMELLTGETLAAHLHGAGALAEPEALALARQMAAGLAAAHQCGVVHRDFKSSNVMLVPGRDGALRAVITDFGLARDPEIHAGTQTLTGTGNLVGTLDYMAPEQLEHGESSFRSDIYSLGLVLFEMVTGHLPFQARTPIGAALQRVRDTPPSPRTLRPQLGPLWENVLARCLDKEPSKRYADATEVAAALEAGPQTSPGRRRRRAVSAAVAALVVVLLALLTGVLFLVSHPASSVLTPVPLTSTPGIEFHPALSPNGELAAFAWDGEKQDNIDIYVKQIASGVVHRVTRDPAVDISPAWSPDGQQIAFRRVLSQGMSQIIVTSYLGGAEHKVAEWPYIPESRIAWENSSPTRERNVCWSPDGKWLVASGRNEATGPDRLFAISLTSGEVRQLTSPPLDKEGDTSPAFSPDGRTLAFTRAAGILHTEVFAMPISAGIRAAGPPRQVTSGDLMASSPAWTADGSSIIFSAGRREDPRRLFRIAVSGPAASLSTPAPERLLGLGEPADQPAVSLDGRRLAYTVVQQDLNIWELHLPSSPSDSPTASSLIASTRSELLPDVSPDGSKIAFTSDRSGTYEVWICDRDGSNPVKLTGMRSRYTGDPHWSPDGKQIAFISHLAASVGQVYVVSAGGGTPQRLTNAAEAVGAPTWSADGKWIYFNYSEHNSRQVWKIPADGGKPVQVTKTGGVYALESHDGKYLYYSKTRGPFSSLWKIPVNGGAESQVLPEVKLGRDFAVTAQGIYFADRASKGNGTAIRFLNFATGGVDSILVIERPVYVGMSVSPDGQSLLYTQLDRTDSDLWLVDNFR